MNEREEFNRSEFNSDYKRSKKSSNRYEPNPHKKNLFNSADQYGENIGQPDSLRAPTSNHADRTIQEEASEILYRAEDVDASDIEISVEAGIVTLQGSVKSSQMKDAAQKWIENLSDVKSVHNELRVQA